MMPNRRGAEGGLSKMEPKWVYGFGEGSGEMRDLLGGKGAGIAEMTRSGIPVPPGFTITTEACRAYYEGGEQLPEGLWEQVEEALGALAAGAGKRVGRPQAPPVWSVRSGARVSMPGMMDTLLNLGLAGPTVTGLAELTGDERFALDAYRRFIQLFGRVVMGVEGPLFEEGLQR